MFHTVENLPMLYLSLCHLIIRDFPRFADRIYRLRYHAFCNQLTGAGFYLGDFSVR